MLLSEWPSLWKAPRLPELQEPSRNTANLIHLSFISEKEQRSTLEWRQSRQALSRTSFRYYSKQLFTLGCYGEGVCGGRCWQVLHFFLIKKNLLSQWAEFSYTLKLYASLKDTFPFLDKRSSTLYCLLEWAGQHWFISFGWMQCSSRACTPKMTLQNSLTSPLFSAYWISVTSRSYLSSLVLGLFFVFFFLLFS